MASPLPLLELLVLEHCTFGILVALVVNLVSTFLLPPSMPLVVNLPLPLVVNGFLGNLEPVLLVLHLLQHLVTLVCLKLTFLLNKVPSVLTLRRPSTKQTLVAALDVVSKANVLAVKLALEPLPVPPTETTLQALVPLLLLALPFLVVPVFQLNLNLVVDLAVLALCDARVPTPLKRAFPHLESGLLKLVHPTSSVKLVEVESSVVSKHFTHFLDWLEKGVRAGSRAFQFIVVYS